MISQSILPQKWVIASDASTDRTDEIVKKYAARYPWIELARVSRDGDRNFARKVHCFREGYERLREIDFDIVGNLDGDVSFDRDYMEYLLDRFEQMPRLGVAGTPYTEGESFHSFKDSYVDVRHVHGQIQMFRRKCFDQISGYIPIEGGGIDSVAVVSARKNGWETRSFQDKTFVHLRQMGTAGTNVVHAQFKAGKKDYSFGSHPLWELFRGAFQMTRKPYILRGLSLMLGYFSCVIRMKKRPVPPEITQFYRREQMQRLRELLSDRLHRQR